MNGLDGSGAWFDDVRVGERFARTLTITETHLVLGAGLIGDFNPHHVDETYARKSRFGTRILHGMITSAIMGAPVGMRFHGTALAYLEHNTRFTAPVRAGDTLTTTWTVTELLRQAEAVGRHRRAERRGDEPGRRGRRRGARQDPRVARAATPSARRAACRARARAPHSATSAGPR